MARDFLDCEPHRCTFPVGGTRRLEGLYCRCLVGGHAPADCQIGSVLYRANTVLFYPREVGILFSLSRVMNIVRFLSHLDQRRRTEMLRSEGFPYPYTSTKRQEVVVGQQRGTLSFAERYSPRSKL